MVEWSKVKKIFLVLLHYKGLSLTEDCLSSLAKIKTGSFEVAILVVINNPEEDYASLSKKFPAAVFLETNQNLGFAEGNNVGLRYALENGADAVLLLNNDTFVAPDFLLKLLAAARRQKKGGLFVPKIYFAPGWEFHHDRYLPSQLGKVLWFAGGRVDWANIATPHRGVDEVDVGQYDTLAPVEFASGCALLVKKEVFEKVGLLEGKYFLYYEDADFCQRALRKGFRIFYVPEAKIWHKVAASSQIGGDLQDYFMVRNQLLFGWRFAPWRSKLALLKQSLRFLLFGRPWQRQGVVDFYLGRWHQGSWS